MKSTRFNNVFVINTGRCGSVSFSEACKIVRNYSTTHESLWGKKLPERIEYPSNHIEIDNRLSFYMGELHKKYGDDALYVHLYRDNLQTARSYFNRITDQNSIAFSWSKSINRSKVPSLQDCLDMVVSQNQNIDFFCSNVKNSMSIDIELIEEEFPKFLNIIGADFDKNSIAGIFSKRLNDSKIVSKKMPINIDESENISLLFDMQYKERLSLKKELRYKSLDIDKIKSQNIKLNSQVNFLNQRISRAFEEEKTLVSLKNEIQKLNSNIVTIKQNLILFRLRGAFNFLRRFFR